MEIIRILLLASVLLPQVARAQDNEVQPCGTVVKSIRLKEDCSAPMIIGADRVTVNLDGHTIRNAPTGFDGDGRGGVEIIDRRGVTIKNGTVIGPTYGLLVQRGGGHTLRSLKVNADGDQITPVVIEDVDHTLVKGVTTNSPFNSAPFKFTGRHSKIYHVTSRGDGAPGATIRGEALLIADSVFDSGSFFEADCGLFFSGERSIVRRNKLTTSATRVSSSANFAGLCAEGNENLFMRNTIVGAATGLILDSAASGNTIRNNTVTSDPTIASEAVDIRGGDNACGNTWKNNDFETDSEGDGPDAGCIR